MSLAKIESYLLALRFTAIVNRIRPATTHRDARVNRPKGTRQSPGAQTGGIINPVSNPAATTTAITKPTPAISAPHRKQVFQVLIMSNTKLTFATQSTRSL